MKNRPHTSSILVSALIVALGPGAIISALDAQESWRLAPQPVFSVGGMEGRGGVDFSRIGDVAVLSDGRFVVADDRDLQIHVFETDGRLQDSFGFEGEGPGEFLRIGKLWVEDGDEIGVWDPRLNRLTRLTDFGTVVATVRPSFGDERAPAGLRNLEILVGALPGGDLVLAGMDVGPREGGMATDALTFAVFDGEGRFKRIVGSGHGMTRLFLPEMSGPPPFSPWPRATLLEGDLVYGNGQAGELMRVPTDRQAPPRVLTIPGPELEFDEALDQLRAAAPDLSLLSDPAVIAAIRSRSGPAPVFAGMFSDDAGRVWIKQYDPGADALPLGGGRPTLGGEWMVLGADGQISARVQMPPDFAPLAVVGDQVLGLTRDAFDVESLVLFDLER